MGASVQIEERVSHYEVIVSLSGELLYLRTMGAEYTSGAHFDEYIMDFSSFKELDGEDEGPFMLPPECSRRPLQRGVQPMAVALASLAPDVHPTTNPALFCLAVLLQARRGDTQAASPNPPSVPHQLSLYPESWLRQSTSNAPHQHTHIHSCTSTHVQISLV